MLKSQIKQNFKTYLVVFNIFSYFFLITNPQFKIRYIFKPQKLQKNLTEIYDNCTAKFFFGIITIDKSIERRKQMFNFTLSHLIEQGHDYMFFSDNILNESVNITAIDPEVSQFSYRKDPNTNRKKKRVSIAKYFIENTTADFLLMSTDDVIIDYLHFPKLVYTLNSKYDTNNDIVILGNCLKIKPHVLFLQGGSGYIFTRAGAKQFLKYGSIWVKTAYGADDVAFTKFLRYLKMSCRQSMCPYMIGHLPKALLTPIDDTDQLPVCPQNFWENFCDHGIHLLENTFIYHESHIDLHETIWNNIKMLLEDEFYTYAWYGVYINSVLCRIDPSVTYRFRESGPFPSLEPKNISTL